jgi:hypothetical protein
MIPAATKTQYTPEDLLTMPDGDFYELVDGILVERKVSILSSYIAGVISSMLFAFCRPKRVGWVFQRGRVTNVFRLTREKFASQTCHSSA